MTTAPTQSGDTPDETPVDWDLRVQIGGGQPLHAGDRQPM